MRSYIKSLKIEYLLKISDFIYNGKRIVYEK